MKYFAAVVFLKPELFTMTVLEEKQNWKIKTLFTSKLSWKWHWKLKNSTIHCISIIKWFWKREAYLEVWEVFWLGFFPLDGWFFHQFQSLICWWFQWIFFACWECHQVEKSSEQLKFDLDRVSTWIPQDIWGSINDFSWWWNTGCCFWLDWCTGSF